MHLFYPRKICIGIVLDLHVPGEIANNDYAKIFGGKEVCYGICASRELKHSLRSMESAFPVGVFKTWSRPYHRKYSCRLVF